MGHYTKGVRGFRSPPRVGGEGLDPPRVAMAPITLGLCLNYGLSDNAAVKLCVVVQMIFDDLVALTGSPFQSYSIQDPDRTPGVLNLPFFFQDCGGRRDRRSSGPQHLSQVFLGQNEGFIGFNQFTPAELSACEERRCTDLLL
jgi:hypothetical protein